MKPVLVSLKVIETIRESLTNGENHFALITADGNEVLECRITERFQSGRKVRCSEDNRVFRSIEEAADYYNCASSQISISIKNNYRCRGKHFHYWYNENHARKFDEWVREKERKKGG